MDFLTSAVNYFLGWISAINIQCWFFTGYLKCCALFYRHGVFV